MPRNCLFSVKLLGVGGSDVAVPMAREGLGGVVERSERMDLLGSTGWSKTYLLSISNGVKGSMGTYNVRIIGQC
jgi:hypothetical protein